MSQSAAPSNPSQNGQSQPDLIHRATDVTILKRNLAIGLLITCPILIALPPRKLDVYTFCLAGTTFISLNHLQKHTTGRSFLNRLGINDEGTISERVRDAASSSGSGGGLPTETARRYQALMREKKAAEREGRVWIPPRTVEEVNVERKEERGVITGLIMGNAPEDWKERRDRKEREALERGDGVGSLIQDYFQEAMGWKKDDEDEDQEAEGKK